MKSSPTIRVFMAAGLYLLLMWGYVALQTPQLFAVFAALIMSIALLFWVGEARERDAGGTVPGQPEQTNSEELADGLSSTQSSDPSVSDSNLRLDSLKADLMKQYAQFGRDQSSLNRKGLGTWHPNRGHRGRSDDDSY